MEALRVLFNRLFAERFLAASDMGVIIVNEAFRIAEISDPICRMFGVTRDAWIGRPAEAWFVETGWAARPPFDKSLLIGRTFHDRQAEWGDGAKRRSLMLDGDILQEEGPGAVRGAYVLFRDVTRLKLLEEQIRRSDQLKTIGQIAAGTAHEIRNPLTAIRGFMQLLNKSLADRQMDREGEYVRVMLSELDRINALVGEFLLLSKPRTAKLAPVKISSILREVLPVIRSEALLHGVVVQYEPDPVAYVVQVDKEQLKQVILNLAKNAIEAMSEGGTLTFDERFDPDKPGKLSISIQDNGPGIPQEVMERIFDPFFTTKQQGTGLGLSICQKIVHELGGRLEVASCPEGTCFTVSLPLSELFRTNENQMSDDGGAAWCNDV